MILNYTGCFKTNTFLRFPGFRERCFEIDSLVEAEISVKLRMTSFTLNKKKT